MDINADIGEEFPFDGALMNVVTSVNVCCGAYAGSPELTRETVRRALEKGLNVGAHPGFPDRDGFGRAAPDEENLAASMADVERQIVWFLTQFKTSYIKFHGALYNLISHEKQFKSAEYLNLIDLLKSCHVPLMGIPGTGMAKLAELSGLGLIKEGFVDRRYTDDGYLVPRSEAEAVITSRAESRTRVTLLAPRVDSLCIHGDEPGCLEMAIMVRSALAEEGYAISATSSK